MTDERDTMQPQPPTREEADRERRTWWILVAIGALIVAGIMALLWPIIGGRLDAAKNLDTAAAILSQSDADVALIVRASSGGPSAETTALVADAQRILPSARGELARGTALASTGFERLTDDEQKRSQLTRAALTARVALLDAAAPILSAEQSASIALPLATRAWNTAVAASAAEKDAVAAYDLKTAAGLDRAASQANTSAEAFAEAYNAFTNAENAYPALKRAGFSAYVKLRVEQSLLFQRAITARRAGDISGANALVISFNDAQARNAQTAKALPATPAQAVADAFAADIAASKIAFERARRKADEADAALKSL